MTHEGFAVIFYILVQWDGYHRRPMIEAVARNCQGVGNVIAVEPPVCLSANAITSPRWTQQWWRQPRLARIHDNLHVLRPWTLVPYRLEKWGLRLGLWRRLVKRQVLDAIRQLRSGRETVFAYITRPDHERYLGIASENQTVYECRDDHSFRDADGGPAGKTHRAEIRMVQIADYVFATSDALCQKMRNLHPNVHLLPNGVDFESFARARKQRLPLPGDLSRIPPPRIGYTGSISPPFDFQLITELALARPRWSFVLVGWRRGVPRDLERMANVHFLGWKPYDDLPDYLRGFDVAILPRVKNRHTDAMNPLKIWEYLAAGRKVVSTQLAQIVPLSDIVFVARSNKEFLAHLETALCSEHDGRVQEGITLAEERSWMRVTRKVVEVLAQAGNREHGTSATARSAEASDTWE